MELKYNLRRRKYTNLHNKQFLMNQSLNNPLFKIELKLNIKTESDNQYLNDKIDDISTHREDDCGSRGCPRRTQGDRRLSRSKLDANIAPIEHRLSSTNNDDQCSQECDFCGRLIDSINIEAHKLVHSKYECTLCGKILKTKWRYNVHRRMHMKKQRYPYSDCEETFEHLVNLVRHISVIHKSHDPSKTECPFCKKVVSAINAHLRTHQESPMTCEFCGATLKNFSAYKSHTRFHNILMKEGRDRAITPKPLVCKKSTVIQCWICEKPLQSQQQMIAHLKTHVQVSLFPCPYCDDYCCSSQEDLVKHVSNIHRYIPQGYSQCPSCADIVSDVDAHMKSVHRQSLYECEICDASFRHRASFWKHFNRRHKIKSSHRSYIDMWIDKHNASKAMKPVNYKKVHCLFCRCLLRVSHIRMHVRLHHHHGSLFACSLCNKVLLDRSTLDLHRHSHDVFPARLSCPVCTLPFLTHLRLVVHMKKCHQLTSSASRKCAHC